MQPLTDTIYWAAQDPEVQKLRFASGAKKQEILEDLVKRGIPLDVVIDVWGYDALWTMNYRSQNHYLYVASSIVPSIPATPSVTPQTLPVPPGYIKVSIDAVDYPPFGSQRQDRKAA